MKIKNANGKQFALRGYIYSISKEDARDYGFSSDGWRLVTIHHDDGSESYLFTHKDTEVSA